MTSTVRWVALALLGIAIAAAVSIAASRLASQQIGLASQPISAGDALVPRAVTRPRTHGRPPTGTPPPRTSTTPTVPPPATVPLSPPTPSAPTRSGGGEGDGGGGGSDD